MAQRRTLITGGAGFIGSHLVDRLLAQGDRVSVIDDLSTGRRENLEQHADSGRLQLTVASVTDEAVLAPLVEQCDRVFHLAAGVGVRLLSDEPARMLDENVHGTATVLKCCARSGKPVLITSSSEVYGKTGALPQREDADVTLGPPTEARWSYACSKAVGEYLALAYFRRQSLPVVVVRLFNTVGPRQRGRYGMVIPRFIDQALSGRPITVYGDGSQTRCFCHVRDAVGAIAALIETPAAYGQVVNLGSEQRVSIAALAKLVREITGSASDIVNEPFEHAYQPGLDDMQERQPDTSRLQALTGFRPTLDLRAILVDTLAHQRGRAREQTG